MRVITVITIAGQDTALISTMRRMQARMDSTLRMNAGWVVAAGPVTRSVMGGSLTSGIAPMQKTLRMHFSDELKDYNSIIEMTKVSGWKP